MHFLTDNDSIGEAVCKRAEALNAAAVVMAKHQRGAIAEFFLGSGAQANGGKEEQWAGCDVSRLCGASAAAAHACTVRVSACQLFSVASPLLSPHHPASLPQSPSTARTTASSRWSCSTDGSPACCSTCAPAVNRPTCLPTLQARPRGLLRRPAVVPTCWPRPPILYAHPWTAASWMPRHKQPMRPLPSALPGFPCRPPCFPLPTAARSGMHRSPHRMTTHSTPT